ncbi:MAG: hypothetical protein OEW73_02630 [Gammaproteobacteria bacterium]|nr:hypothetical protein [Gammaproteobacteria bacterium]MDH5239661.1 hypothetical protein [Gammaproteobacteria bacterium]MDH5260100.1 hypothetical protein [Gammaproteobacteria bacterium]MDH5582241.1 hypothetical protein [Gammaproteobacteria bacterium]
MKKIAITAIALLSSMSAAAEHQYIDFSRAGHMVIAGPFNVVIPIPENARVGEPEHTTEKFLTETLKVSKAGYFADDQFVMVQVETTNAPAGTLTNENLPTYAIGDRIFRARTLCMDISQEDLEANDAPLLEYVEAYNVQIVPAVRAVELSVTTDDGTGEGSIVYMRNVPGGCDAMTPEFESEFDAAFARFIESIQDRN